MDEIRDFLFGEDKSWSKGIELLKKYSKNEKETSFLAKVEKPEKMHASMMLKRFGNILRIADQQGKANEPVKEEIRPITVQRVHFSKTPKKLTQSKELTNKLLARQWGQLDEKEQAYFKGNAEVFAFKKELFFRNSSIESELKTLHASLPHAEDDDERKKIAEKLVTLKKEQNDNWAKIDNFELVPEVKETDKPNNEAELIKKRNNLRSYVSKLEKQVEKEPGHKNFEKRKASLEQAKKDLDETEKAISV